MSSVNFVNEKAENLDKEKALLMNSSAATSLQSVLRTNLGPKGTEKMLVGGAGQVKITKDGNVLLHEMTIIHPTAQMIARAATAQDDTVGDGSSSNVLFISAFILTRVYLLFKYYAKYSKWGGVFASMVCSECNANGGHIFTFKASIKERSFIFVLFFVLCTILIFGYALRNCEISFVRNVPEKYFQDWTRISNGFWFFFKMIFH